MEREALRILIGEDTTKRRKILWQPLKVLTWMMGRDTERARGLFDAYEFGLLKGFTSFSK